MEDLLVILVMGLTLSGMWITVRDIRRTENKFRIHHDPEPDYWHLGGDEVCRGDCGSINGSEWGNWDWLELLDLG